MSTSSFDPATAGTHRSARHVWPQVYWHNDGYTPRNWTWNTEKKTEKEVPLGNHHFQVPCYIFSGGKLYNMAGMYKIPSFNRSHTSSWFTSSLLCWLYGSEQKKQLSGYLRIRTWFFLHSCKVFRSTMFHMFVMPTLPTHTNSSALD